MVEILSLALNSLLNSLVELFYYVEWLKENREHLSLDLIRDRAREIFTRLKIDMIFLDEDLIQEFLSQKRVCVKQHNAEVLQARVDQNKIADDMLRFFARKLVDLVDKEFHLDKVAL